MSRATQPARYDLIIVGGGMVGAALAAVLRDAPLTIALIEGQAPAEPDAATIDLRVSALNRASQRLLEQVDAWAALRDHACPYQRMMVWDAGGTGSTCFEAAEIGEPDLGHIVENGRVQHALWKRLETQRNLTLLCPNRLDSLSPGDGVTHLRLDNGRRLRGRLVVGADGGRSRVRTLAGIATSGWSYGQKTIVANVRTTRHHRHTAWQRFLPGGPVAFLPLHDGRCSIAWHTRSEEADRLMALDDTAFCAAYTRATGQALGRVETVGPRGCFALHRRHAVNYYRGRVALVGDAAHTIHPLAGQGVNLGLLDAAHLANLLADAARRRRDPAGPRVLTRYERQRRAHNSATMRLMDLFATLYAVENPVARWGRSLAMDLANSAGPIKNMIIRYAMGTGVSPALLALPPSTQRFARQPASGPALIRHITRDLSE